MVSSARIPFLLAGLGSLLTASSAPWPAWRGPNQDGTTSESQFPLHWSPTNHVRWRTELPGPGNSTPIVWNQTLFLTQALPKPSNRSILAFDRVTGRMLWQSGTAWEEAEDTHEDNPFCAASPVTDGERVIAYLGSAGVWAVDFDGTVLWRRDLGRQKHEWGYSSSPVIVGDQVIVYHGPGPSSRLVALEKRSGKITWQVDLPEPTPTERSDGFKGRTPGTVGTFGSPVVVNASGRQEVVLGFPESLRAYAPETGKELWRSSGLNPLVYTTPVPVTSPPMILAFGGFYGSAIAVRPGGSGDVTSTHRLWREERSKKNRIGSAVVKGGHAYFANMEGFFECLELGTGKQIWEERLNGPGAADGSWSSPTLAGDRIYMLNKSGDALVLRASPKFEILATNTVAEPLNASPAMSDGEIFIRTWNALWCISEKARLASNRQ
ncbi:MAG: PQQ-binding-like beta-propeller repeat protein [Verrucomicrobiales bacterium]|nr:PQQ-binding-like beta-propeller repeat protein [Verrucomicrobiales bacterium]